MMFLRGGESDHFTPLPLPRRGGGNVSQGPISDVSINIQGKSNVPVPQAKASVSDLDYIIFSVNDFEDKISELKDNSAPGPDQITGKLLKSLKTTICKPLQLIFNKSLSEKTAPREWKDAIVIPIFKKWTKGSPSNNRPVSLTSIVCKIMEQLIKEKIVEGSNSYANSTE